jgi:hypothetical protein
MTLLITAAAGHHFALSEMIYDTYLTPYVIISKNYGVPPESSPMPQ